jgi:HAE1 family hydrophobic/amphiphilic exporter-1
MAHAVIGGLITSTLLTLFVVPVAYTLRDDLVAKVLGRPTGGPGSAATPVSAA